ncbi:hypothetical protein D031_3020B, partial [Vibrio parahaemolyticus VP-48]
PRNAAINCVSTIGNGVQPNAFWNTSKSSPQA